MTRKEAIEWNKNLKMYMKLSDRIRPYKFLEDNYIALDMAIQALDQDPCEEAISKQAVLDVLAKYDNDMKSDVYNEIFDNIDKLPSVNPVKTGHWIDDGQYAEGHSQHVYRCSECNKIYIGYIGKYKECPECKAKMEELTKSED